MPVYPVQENQRDDCAADVQHNLQPGWDIPEGGTTDDVRRTKSFFEHRSLADWRWQIAEGVGCIAIGISAQL
jgi:hypothetical protein